VAHNNLGKALLQKGQVDEAMGHFQKAVEIQPDYAEAQYFLGAAFVLKGQFDDAASCFQKVLKIQPDYALAAENLGSVLLQQGRVDQAITNFQRVVQLQPRNIKVLNDLAWVLATCPEASLRDGAKAIQLAEHADQFAGGKNPAIASTLAAAYAEAGRFPDAIAAAQRALELLPAQADAARVSSLKARLEGYQSGMPFRDASLTNHLNQPGPAER
jgi:tetratricopeptide (TPR) repeat protein